MPPGLEITDPAAYRQKLRDLLGGRDEVVVIAETPQRVQDLFAGVSDEVARRRPFAGKWTPLEVLGHLVDAEWSFAWRLRTTLSDDRPTLEPMDQQKWVTAQRHNERTVGELLGAFESLRRLNAPIWAALTTEQLERTALHRQRGEESLSTMRLMLAGHDLSHLDQIDRYLAACR